MISKIHFERLGISRRSLVCAIGLFFGGCASSKDAATKPPPLFTNQGDSFSQSFNSCLGVPMANYYNYNLKAYDDAMVQIRVAYPIAPTGKLPIIACTVEEGTDPSSFDLMIGALASKGFFVTLILPSKITPPKGIDPNVHKNTRRAQQIRFVLDKMYEIVGFLQSERLNVDFENIGIAGHGEAAWTALELIGWGRGLLPSSELADGRIKAAFALKPSPSSLQTKIQDMATSRVIYGRTMIAGDLDDIPPPPIGSGVLGLGLPSASSGFGGLLGRIKDPHKKEKPQREILAAACAAAGFFFEWSLKGKKDRFNDLVALDGKEIPSIDKKLSFVRS